MAKKEYIEREAVLDLIRENDKCGYVEIRTESLLYYVNNIPAADVVEVRHGVPDPIDEVYEDTDGNTYRQIVWYECPFCGSDRIAKYCADCGAKMDGGMHDA